MYAVTVTSVPLLRDLHEHITPHYATHWRVIGTRLGLSTGALDIIENDNMHKAVQCCNGMLKKWLELDTTASWEKLFEVIESPAVGCAFRSDNGMYVNVVTAKYIHVHIEVASCTLSCRLWLYTI